MSIRKRTCPSCGQNKPLTKNYFQKHGPYLNRICKSCEKERRSTNVEDVIRRMLVHFKQRSSSFHVNFDLTREYLLCLFDAQEGKCFYTDTPLQMTVTTRKDPNGISLDRVIPEEGYTQGNVVFCTRWSNTVKSNLSLEELGEFYPDWMHRLERLTQITDQCEDTLSADSEEPLSEGLDISSCDMRGNMYGVRARCRGTADRSVSVYEDPRYHSSEHDDINVCNNCYRALKRAEHRGKIGKVVLD